MPIIESKATALLRFTGLGIVLFNTEKNRGEIAIIRDDKHELTIKLQRPRLRDGSERDMIIYEDVAVYTDLPKAGVEISISGVGSATTNGYEIYRSPGEFDRLSSNDPNDFRWVVKMDDLHDDGVYPTRSSDGFPISKLFIENGLFYVHKLDTELFFEKIEKDIDGNERSRETYGNVAETIGVVIDADDVVIKVSIGGEERLHTFTKIEGIPYRIEIKNMNYSDGAAISDMPDYYKYLAPKSGNQLELSPIKTDALGNAITADAFCHPVGGGGDIVSIDELLS